MQVNYFVQDGMITIIFEKVEKKMVAKLGT